MCCQQGIVPTGCSLIFCLSTIMQRVFDLAAHLGVGRASGDAEPSRLKLVVLNQPIWRLDIFLRLWQNTVVRVCADGGANRLFEAFSPDQEGRIHYV